MLLKKIFHLPTLRKHVLFKKITWKTSLPLLVASSACSFMLASCSETPDIEQQKPIPATELVTNFITPPDETRLGTYWYWINDNISADGIKKDLQFMSDIGIGRAFIGNIGGLSGSNSYPPQGDVKIFSDQWWHITSTAIETAFDLDMEIGVFNSPGWSMSGGPWIKPEQSMRYITSATVHVTGPSPLNTTITVPNKDFQDVITLAFPAPEGKSLNSLAPKVSASVAIPSLSALTDGDLNSDTIMPIKKLSSKKAKISIDFEVKEHFTARSLVIHPAAISFTADMELQSLQGDNYQTIRKFKYDRKRLKGDMKIGFMPKGPEVFALDDTASTNFRLIVSNMTSKGGFAEIEISSAARLDQYIEKQLGQMKDHPTPLWNEYKWTAQTETDSKLAIARNSIIDISNSVSKDGTINWQVPEGDWIITRYGMVTTGVENHPSTAEGVGLEVDKMSVEHVKHHFNSFAKKIQARVPAEKRDALKWLIADSYEVGAQNWSDDFAKQFQQQYGYDAKKYLPVLNGHLVGNADKSERFLWDIRRLVADNISYKYVGGLKKIANEHGLKLWLENYGHWGFPGEFLQYGGQSDAVAGEFWNEMLGPPGKQWDLGAIEVKAAASSAHIYGKTKVSVEAFTSSGKQYKRHPATLKKRGDFAFANGANDIVLHLYIAQPYEDRAPGVNAWFGTEFNRNNTWFTHAHAYTDYLRRTMHMLQQGHPVSDVAYFIGESAPAMTGTEQPRLPKGYSFDFINAEVLLNRISVDKGDLVLPEGIRYKMLVLPPLTTMRPGILSRISDLVKQGATIFGPAPSSSPSLQSYPVADIKVKRLAAELWGKVDGKDVTARKFGKGGVFDGENLDEALTALSMQPDFDFDAKLPLLFNHRQVEGKDIYFVSNQSKDALSFSPTFRIKGKQPEHWNPVTTEVRNLSEYTETEAGITVPLTLDAFESAFIVFEQPLEANTGIPNFPTPQKLATLNKPWQVTFDKAMGGPAAPVTFNTLSDWSKNSDPAIKTYSGTAVYNTTFTVDNLAKGKKYLLDLGKVKVIAKVKVNGINVGAAWTAPWSVDISKALQLGENKLEIMVVNTWVNKIVSDLNLPEAERSTWVSTPTFTKKTPLDSSGLMGPVTLQSVEQ